MTSIFAVSARASAERVLVVTASDAPIVVRLEAELTAAGLEPLREPIDTMPDERALDAIARERGASAFVTIAPPIVRVSSVDGAVATELSFDGSEGSEELVVLRAVELLRASALEVRAPDPVPSAPIDLVPPPEPARPAPRERGPFAIDLGASVLGSPGGPDPSVQIRVGASVRVDRWLALALDAWVPFYPVVVSAPEGAADLFTGELTFAVRVPLLDDAEPLVPHVGVGVLAVLASAQGRANPRFASRAPLAFDAGPLVEVGVRWALTRELALRADITAAVLPSPIVVRFAERAVTTLGWPMLAGSIALEIAP